MPQERPAPKLPGAGSARLHRWIARDGSEVCADCGVEAGEKTRFSFCPGRRPGPDSRGPGG